MVQGVALAFGDRPQAGAQLVAARPDGLERGAGREADLALDTVDLDGGQRGTRVWPIGMSVAGSAEPGVPLSRVVQDPDEADWVVVGSFDRKVDVRGGRLELVV